jgi:hypothetical protein
MLDSSANGSKSPEDDSLRGGSADGEGSFDNGQGLENRKRCRNGTAENTAILSGGLVGGHPKSGFLIEFSD